jgi:two-component system response regulator FixJ
MPEPRLVYVIDDEEAVRDSMILLLESRGLVVQSFASGVGFVKVASSVPLGCVVTDMRMPEVDGLELLKGLSERNVRLPVIVMTGHDEVSLAVEALKAGAVDFIEKPCPAHVLVDAVLSALQAIEQPERETETTEIAERFSSLTPYEREVMQAVIAGTPNREIAGKLGMTEGAVELHRARVMEKMHARSLSALARMAVVIDQGLIPKAG